jgi:hypothetical protein
MAGLILYRNHLKNREFEKPPCQIPDSSGSFCIERQPEFVRMGVPFLHERDLPHKPWISFKLFKRIYTGSVCFLRWAETFSDPQTALFFSAQKKLLKLHANPFDIAQWFQEASKVSQGVVEVKTVKGEKKNSTVFALFFNTLSMSKATVDVVKCLKDTHIIDLIEFTPIPSRAITGFMCLSRLALQIRELYEKYGTSARPLSKVRDALIHRKMDKDLVWKCLQGVRRFFSFLRALLFALSFFFGFTLSSFLLLCISTFQLFSSLAIDMRVHSL